MTGLPSLGLISHGTSSALGQSLIEALAGAVSDDLRARGLVDGVMLGHVDVQDPGVEEVIDRLPADRPAVLVPLLLSPGYHVHVDLADALEGADDRDIRLAPTLGPDPRLARVLAERLPRLRDDDAVVLAAAGSSDERANASCEEMGRLLADELGHAVSVGFLAGGGAPLKAIVEQKRQSGSRLVIANYLLAPGFFDDLARTLISAAAPSAESVLGASSDAGEGAVLAPPLLAPGADAAGLSVANSNADPGSSPGPRDPRAHAVPAELVDIVRDRLFDAL